MNSIRIMIADYNEAFRENLAELLQSHFTVKTCDNGKDASALLQQFEPEILVLDLMLPGADPFALLGDAIQRGTEIYIFSNFISVPVRERLLSMGIYGMMPKTCDIYQAEYNIRAMARRLPAVIRQQDTEAVSELLIRLGFHTHLEGYDHLLYAIPMYARDPRQPLNKGILGDVAKRFGLSGDKPVERAIRDAIKASCNRGDAALWQHLFPEENRGKKGYPTNKHFISRICEYLLRDNRSR